ncbi:hypothetical protein [Streptomyces sp. NPDC090798]|uniref:hypothetical protein n=1 Tax=Streptomyces sp. NPDC090798 TaxID=3365968 RepID=UPI00382CB9CA
MAGGDLPEPPQDRVQPFDEADRGQSQAVVGEEQREDAPGEAAIAGATGGMASGIMVAATDYPALALTGGALALVPAVAAPANRR